MSDTTRDLTDETVASLLVDTEPYLSCDECFERIDHYVECRLADPSHHDPQMSAHLAGCGVCADEAEALEELIRKEDA